MHRDEYGLFVPGRLCLLGEHSDWAGAYRVENPALHPGRAIIVPTNQGNYARVKELPEKIVYYQATPHGQMLRVPLELQALAQTAKEHGFCAYVAGVALEMVTRFPHRLTHGLEIDNYKSTLPVKRGLSSSASACGLTALAFNVVYDLGLSPSELLEIAYCGERQTASSCGRMDQACLYNQTLEMQFDATQIAIKPLQVRREIHLLVVDLNAGKNTPKILTALQRGYPFAKSNREEEIQHYLGELNYELTQQAIDFIRAGDAAGLGKIMNQSQELFDLYCAPACPEELTSPRLHELLSMKELQDHIYGCKGVGSQGDGSAQLLLRSRADREIVQNFLQKEKGLDCFPLDLR